MLHPSVDTLLVHFDLDNWGVYKMRACLLIEEPIEQKVVH